jgi:hypothetical protein
MKSGKWNLEAKISNYQFNINPISIKFEKPNEKLYQICLEKNVQVIAEVN